MTTINVFLADLPKEVAYPAPIRRFLQDALDRTVRARKLGVDIHVQWSSRQPSPGKHDLLVYFVKDSGDSVVNTGLGSSRRPVSAGGGDGGNGWTAFTSRKVVGSEVYLAGFNNSSDSAQLGRVALHELMHNMSLTGDAMHKPGMKIGGRVTDEDAALSNGDMDFIAAHLTRTSRTQWTGGYRHYHDPARDGGF